ncbi:MAG: digeranylgeranylglycerophospholipid reductase [Candidatus Poribacteria bacterium]|nr:MAG: digeranylgeranylglycerophospholipid reductase [Candidatus Poribacteria bacterium]
MKSAYDVVVVGAGPGGSTAARFAAELGLDVLLLEKRQEIGAPVRCAEGIGTQVLRRFIEPDPKWVAQVINSCRIYAPNGKYIRLEAPGEGLILERKIFDRRLAELAAEKGATVRCKARVTGVLQEGETVTGVTVNAMGQEHRIHAQIVIAADGVESQVARWAGLNTMVKLAEMDVAAQYLVSGIRLEEPDACWFYVGRAYAPGGYAWVFPKRENLANIGLGITPLHTIKTGETALDVLNRFMAKHFPDASIVSMVVGGIPIDGKTRPISKSGLMVVGDAAHQADPMTGGGIANAMIAGQIAAQVAAKALRNGDVSAEALKEYDRRWHKEVGRAFKPLKQIVEEVIEYPDEFFNELADQLHDRPRLNLVDVFKIALRASPRLMWSLGQLVAMGWF